MADSVTFSLDSAELLRALARFPDRCARKVKAAAKVTAEKLASEARVRVARGKTNLLHDSIEVRENYYKDGYVVGAFTKAYGASKGVPARSSNIPFWVEQGTKFAAAKPFLLNSARLEEGSHERRIREAITEAVEEEGLGA